MLENNDLEVLETLIEWMLEKKKSVARNRHKNLGILAKTDWFYLLL